VLGSQSPVKIVQEFQSELLASLDLAPDAWVAPGVSIAATKGRVGRQSASGYVVGEHFVIWCDPGVADQVAAFQADGSGDLLDQWKSFGASIGATLGRAGVVYVLPPGAAVGDPDGVISIDPDVPDDMERLLGFLATCDEDDLDEADIYVDSLDSLIRCTEASPDGPLTSYASALPFEQVPRWWDIGVLTPVEFRRQGLGTQCVRAVIAQTLADGNQPLYRHDADNIASQQVALGLGFVPATRLAAIGFS